MRACVRTVMVTVTAMVTATVMVTSILSAYRYQLYLFIKTCEPVHNQGTSPSECMQRQEQRCCSRSVTLTITLSCFAQPAEVLRREAPSGECITLTLILLHQPETTATFGSIHRLCHSNYDLPRPPTSVAQKHAYHYYKQCLHVLTKLKNIHTHCVIQNKRTEENLRPKALHALSGCTLCSHPTPHARFQPFICLFLAREFTYIQHTLCVLEDGKRSRPSL
jgi:hypothetical protein